MMLQLPRRRLLLLQLQLQLQLLQLLAGLASGNSPLIETGD